MLNQSMFLYSHGYELMVHKVCIERYLPFLFIYFLIYFEFYSEKIEETFFFFSKFFIEEFM